LASLKPLRKTAPKSPTRTSVMRRSWSRNDAGTNGFSATCTAASDAESVIVMAQEVATNPSRHSTNTLPFQNESTYSSIEIEPCPWGLFAATMRYIGSMPSRVKRTISMVAMGNWTMRLCS
jgi:hypothetical protein